MKRAKTSMQARWLKVPNQTPLANLKITYSATTVPIIPILPIIPTTELLATIIRCFLPRANLLTAII